MKLLLLRNDYSEIPLTRKILGITRIFKKYSMINYFVRKMNTIVASTNEGEKIDCALPLHTTADYTTQYAGARAETRPVEGLIPYKSRIHLAQKYLFLFAFFFTKNP